MSLVLRRVPAASAGRLVLGVALLLACSGGCSPGVREDRTITFSAAGDAAAFQHGRHGVFIADPQGGTPRSIFTPGPDVIAVSPPRWSPDGQRLVFATAKALAGAPAPGSPSPETRAAGAVNRHGPSAMTVWFYDKGAAQPGAEKLCEFPVGHAGYVAADLAVRWHPRGDRLLVVRRLAGGERHALHLYDLARGTWAPAFLHHAEHLIFDLSPDGRYLACVLGGKQATSFDGVWVGPLDGAGWWHVPASGNLAWSEVYSTLERLRATRPVWTADGKRFAFLTTAPGQQP